MDFCSELTSILSDPLNTVPEQCIPYSDELLGCNFWLFLRLRNSNRNLWSPAQLWQ